MFKPTDTHQLLNKSSFHPKHTFAGIIKSQITRYCKICSQITDFKTACTVLFNALRKRGYSKGFLRSIKSETLANIKTCNSLNTSFNYNPNIDASSTQCERPFCPNCEYFEPRSEIVRTAAKQTFKMQTNISCNSNNLIYLIECDNCGLQYIGQTKRSLRHRFHSHRFDILNNRKTSVANHFNQLRCEMFDCSITPIFKCPTLESEELMAKKRLEIEQYFISLLKTYQPFGLNISKRKGNIQTPEQSNLSAGVSLLSCICGNAAALPETQLRAAGAAARSQRSQRSQSSNSKCYRQYGSPKAQ